VAAVPEQTLVGRTAELEAVDRLLEAARAGRSGGLVLLGEPGVGKTALLEYAVSVATDLQVASIVAVQSEAELGFAALHQLLIPFLDGLGELPDPQREALESAFGRSAGPPPDRFFVGLAALTLITEAAIEQPVLCVIDDAQWLDRSSSDALGFLARRLLAEPVAMLFAVRDGRQPSPLLTGLPRLELAGLSDDAASELLASHAVGPVDESVRRRIFAQTARNPLALIELAAELTPEELSGRAPLSDPLPVGRRLEAVFLSRLRALPDRAQRLVLLAAAEPSGDAALLWRAAARLGIEPGDAGDVDAVGRLMSLAPRVRFRHPLIRSAVYYGATEPGSDRAPPR
jgi:AAA ATPase domain